MDPSAAQDAVAMRLEDLAAQPDFRLLRPLLDRLGPAAIVDLCGSGPSGWPSSGRLELGAILLDKETSEPQALHGVLQTGPGFSTALTRRSERAGENPELNPSLEAAATAWADLLRGRILIAHDADRVRRLLSRDVSFVASTLRVLDTCDLLMVTHPDTPDLELASWVPRVLGRTAGRRAGERALDLLSLLVGLAVGAHSGERRYGHARDALERYSPESPWLALFADTANPLEHDEVAVSQMVEIPESHEEPVPFEVEAIAAALADPARAARHFPGYRVRQEQITLMRGFFHNLSGGGSLLLEGGTGVGKSLAYLAAAIPFARARAEAGERDPIVISTRTKLLQDQLLERDIAAAARMLGHAQLQALSIKGRANYVCERRLQETLAVGSDYELLPEDRLTHSILLSCARIRSGGEVGSLPRAMSRRRPLLRDLIHRSVSRRAEQCSREQCGHQRQCPFGQRRLALGKADLVVTNHDLLLRWPPDYPRFRHVIADEAHDLAAVADDVYAQVVRPEELRQRIDEVFGSPAASAGSGESRAGLLPRKLRLEAAPTVGPARRALSSDLAAVGRAVAEHASSYGEFELPMDASGLFPEAAEMAESAAARLDELSRLAEALDIRAEWGPGEESAVGEGLTPVQKQAQALSEAAVGLRRAFSETGEDSVAAFDRLTAPHDQWILAIRAVSPAHDFHEHFMESLDSFAGVSASLFVGGDAFAAMGELEIEERSGFGVEKISVPSPFDYARNMRVATIRSGPESVDLVGETTAVIADLARLLGGRTMGLFSSLRRMNQVAERLEEILRADQIEVLAPRRAADDPGGLVRRFRNLPGGGVLLGSRTFWQGLDIPGDDLQALVIEKLPFEVPTELRRRREMLVRELGQNAFERYRLGKMLLNLKQMSGRLIRGESDRGLVVIVEGRTHRGYFDQLESALPPEVGVRVVERSVLPELLAELGLGPILTNRGAK